MNKLERRVHAFIIGMVSLISTIHVVDFFELSNPTWLAITLAIAFEIGAAASLASLIVLDRVNAAIVWALFFTLTFMQAMGNTYYAFSHVMEFTAWSELFGITDESIIFQKRILSLISGAILPVIALGFIKALVDYIRPEAEAAANASENPTSDLDVINDLLTDIEPTALIKEDYGYKEQAEHEAKKYSHENNISAEAEQEAEDLYNEVYSKDEEGNVKDKNYRGDGLWQEEKFSNTPKPLMKQETKPKHIRGSKGDSNINI